jgi:hypothetical protein
MLHMSFSTTGPSNANIVMASATSHDAASAAILSFAETFSLPAIRTRRRYALVSLSCRIPSSSARLSLSSTPSAVACHVRMPAANICRTSFRGFQGYIHNFSRYDRPFPTMCLISVIKRSLLILALSTWRPITVLESYYRLITLQCQMI